LTDADSENSETQVWLDFAESCQYLSADDKLALVDASLEIGRLLQYMINNPGKFGV
jgi:hypothetical protein